MPKLERTFQYQLPSDRSEVATAYHTAEDSLIILDRPETWRDGPRDGRFCVTHRQTGCVVAYARTLRKARLLAAVCGALPVPWSTLTSQRQAVT